jgi:beta-alanine degradation protein BauB
LRSFQKRVTAAMDKADGAPFARSRGRRGSTKIGGRELDSQPGHATKEQAVTDPTQTDPDKYKVVFENERVRVLEYRDEPGQRTSPHQHPDSVMVTLSSFDRRLIGEGGETRDVTLEQGLVRWLDAQTHSGENIATTPTHAFFVELKEPSEREGAGKLGPT